MSSPFLACSSGTAETFGCDARGAILVPAIVMGALLTGALFYVAAAGDAIIFRTQLQDAADTTAFTSAVWHAKGMNIVAVINILMALLLTVIVLFHVLEVICLLVALIPPAAPVALNVFQTLIKIEERVSKGIGAGLKALHVTQQGVAVAVPYIAALEAKRTPTAAESVWPASLSLVPVPIDHVFVQERTRMPSLGPAALPVQESEFGELCARATTIMPDQILELLDKFADSSPIPFVGGALKNGIESAWNTVKEPIETVAESGDGLLCRPVNDLIAALATMVAGKVDENLGTKACNSKADDDERLAREAAEKEANTPNPDGTRKPPPPPPTAAEKRAAKQKRDKQVGACASDIANNLRKSTDISVPPAAVWTAAANGNVFMHTWSRASGTPRFFGSDVRLVAMAGGGHRPQVTPSTVAVAEAEYYVDCDAEWSKCQGDALWAPNWTARMRRFRWPQVELAKMGKESVLNAGNVLQDVAFEQGEQVLGQLLGKAAGDFAGEAIAALIVSTVQKWEPFNGLVDKFNQAIADGAAATGVSELLEIRDEEERRVH